MPFLPEDLFPIPQRHASTAMTTRLQVADLERRKAAIREDTARRAHSAVTQRTSVPRLINSGGTTAPTQENFFSAVASLAPGGQPADWGSLFSMATSFMPGGRPAEWSALIPQTPGQWAAAIVPPAVAAGVGFGLYKLFSGEAAPTPENGVAYGWNTGTAQFLRLTDGSIAVQKKNGVIKRYRPAKHIVVPKNPKIGTLLKADKKVDKLMSGLRKRSKKLR